MFNIEANKPIPILKPREALKPDDIKFQFKENTPSRFHRYEIKLPISPQCPPVSQTFDEITLIMWVKKSISSNNIKDFGDCAFLFCCGLASNPFQLDNQDASFINYFAQKLNAVGISSPVFLGLSCPGFTGSEPKKSLSLTEKNLSAENYAYLIAYVLDALQIDHAPVIGHSAGAEAALLYLSSVNKKLIYWATENDNNRPIIALNPAINKNGAFRFSMLAFAEKLKLILPEFAQKGLTKGVIRFLLTLPWFTNLPTPAKEQILMHLNESYNHRVAYERKLTELARKSPIDTEILKNALIITARKDRLTPANPYFIGVFPNYNISSIGHDDVFIYPSIQAQYINKIIGYLSKKNFFNKLIYSPTNKKNREVK